jgi:hypothetical protein
LRAHSSASSSNYHSGTPAAPAVRFAADQPSGLPGDGDLASRRDALNRTVAERLVSDTNAPLPDQPAGCGLLRRQTARGAAATRANAELVEFYATQQRSPTNAEVIFPGMLHPVDSSAELDIALERKASFVSIAPQLASIGDFLGSEKNGHRKKLDGASHVLLNNLVRSVQFHAENVQVKAVEAGRAGQQVLPLALNPQHFSGFLRAQALRLEQIVTTCKESDEPRIDLEKLLSAFGTAYLSEGQLLPRGTPARQGRACKVPLSVVLCSQPFVAYQYRYQRCGTDDYATIDLSTDLLEAELKRFTNRLAGFEQHPPFAQRAALILQVTVGALVDLEERIAAGGLHAIAAARQAACAGTAAELAYAGHEQIGDRCLNDMGGMDERMDRLAPMVLLRQKATAYQQKHRERLVSDDALHQWVHGPAYLNDLRAIGSPCARMGTAQCVSTARMLLAQRAFQIARPEASTSAGGS